MKEKRKLKNYIIWIDVAEKHGIVSSVFIFPDEMSGFY